MRTTIAALLLCAAVLFWSEIRTVLSLWHEARHSGKEHGPEDDQKGL
jgi:hypothetical protein